MWISNQKVAWAKQKENDVVAGLLHLFLGKRVTLQQRCGPGSYCYNGYITDIKSYDVAIIVEIFCPKTKHVQTMSFEYFARNLVK